MRKQTMTSGDALTLSFIALDQSGAAVDISAYTDIDIAIYAMAGGKPSGAAIVSENIAGAVALVGGGTGGKYELALAEGDTSGVSGDHWLEVRYTDAAGMLLTAPPMILSITADLQVS